VPLFKGREPVRSETPSVVYRSRGIESLGVSSCSPWPGIAFEEPAPASLRRPSHTFASASSCTASRLARRHDLAPANQRRPRDESADTSYRLLQPTLLPFSRRASAPRAAARSRRVSPSLPGEPIRSRRIASLRRTSLVASGAVRPLVRTGGRTSDAPSPPEPSNPLGDPRHSLGRARFRRFSVKRSGLPRARAPSTDSGPRRAGCPTAERDAFAERVPARFALALSERVARWTFPRALARPRPGSTRSRLSASAACHTTRGHLRGLRVPEHPRCSSGRPRGRPTRRPARGATALSGLAPVRYRPRIRCHPVERRGPGRTLAASPESRPRFTRPSAKRDGRLQARCVPPPPSASPLSFGLVPPRRRPAGFPRCRSPDASSTTAPLGL
jgi:hypothetical protein